MNAEVDAGAAPVAKQVRLEFRAGTVELHGLGEQDASWLEACRWDRRTRCLRAPAAAYPRIFLALGQAELTIDDRARAYEQLTLRPRVRREPRPFQREALDAWLAAGGSGVVVLPTGAGKSHLAVMAMAQRPRTTLIIAPTLDLVRQWYDLLRAHFGEGVGVVGGGEYSVEKLTVTTYDSAYLHMERFGNRFGMVVFDECHHLPGRSYALAAQSCIAPFRLGLTATPERNDGRESELGELIGGVVYRRDVGELAGEFLATYEVSRIDVELSTEERQQYDEARGQYLAFLRKQGIRMNGAKGWSTFIMRAARTDDGRRALDAYHKQRALAFAAPEKLSRIEELLELHRLDRTLIFTQDNATAYDIARRFLLPIITHQTKVRERSDILERFGRGSYSALVTSKVLNEGVDVPDANVAIVVSGSGSVREHVQRLGRILRRRGDKHAMLYELVTRATTESNTSDRRRDHAAYRP